MPVKSNIVACCWLLAALAFVLYSIARIWEALATVGYPFPRAWLLAILLLAVPVGVVAVAVLLGRIWGWWGLVALSSLGIIAVIAVVVLVCILRRGGGDNRWVINAVPGVVLGLPPLISLLVLVQNRPGKTTSIR